MRRATSSSQAASTDSSCVSSRLSIESQQGRRVPIRKRERFFQKLGGFLGHASILPERVRLRQGRNKPYAGKKKAVGINLSPQSWTIRPTPAVHLAHARPRTRPRKTFT